MAKCLVLGANGFLGSHLVDSLVQHGHEVRAFDRFANVQPNFIAAEKIEKFTGDFLNRYDLSRALEGIEYVFHFISTTTPIAAENDPLIDIETNIRMSVELFQECVKKGVKKVIFASTGGSIYGSNSTEHVGEDILPAPVSPYAIGKLTIEHYLHYFDRKHGLKSLVFRISNPYGERQSLSAKQGVIPIFLQHIASGEPITILGDGNMVRDYIYVKDVAELIANAFEVNEENLYNLGSGHGLTVNELVEIVKKVVDEPVRIEHQENLPTFVEKIVLDTSRYTDEFGQYKLVDVEEGVHNTWQYIVQKLRSS